MDPQTIIARRVALELRPGNLVNLGIGIPTLVANYVPPGLNVFFQSENGLLRVTVTDLSSDEPSTDAIWSKPVVANSAAHPPLAGSALFWMSQVNWTSLAVMGWPSDQTAFGLIL